MSQTEARTAAEELEILEPNRVVMINKENLTVHEFGFIEGMAMAAGLAPMLVDMSGLFDSKDLGLNALSAVFAKHAEVWVDCMAKATGKDVDWVKGLGDEDGSHLSMMVWVVNKGFFIRRIMTYRKEVMMREEMEKAAAAAQSKPESFTPASSPAATDSQT